MAYTTINKHTSYFNTKLYSGNASTQAITGVGFQPDWCWFKGRNFADNHVSIDAVRGTNKAVYQDTTGSSTTQTHYFTSFDSDGYTLGNSGIMNGSSKTYASWNWKANGAGSTNNDGSVASTVSVNTTAGFSIVKWTGTGATATVGHGLGAKPSIVLIKNTGATENWVMYHSSLTAEKNLKLNNQEAAQDTTGAFNDTEPTSSVFTVHTNTNTNQNGQVMIAYCFAEKTGYSKFGSYTGNGNVDGTFVYTGFKPSLIIVKRDTAGYDWLMYTDKINNINPMNDYINPNANSAETVDNANQVLDIVSNGFKHRGTGSSTNANTKTYFYLAFGQSLVGSNNVPCTAR